MTTLQDHNVSWKMCPPRTSTCQWSQFAYRRARRDNPGTTGGLPVHIAE